MEDSQNVGVVLKFVGIAKDRQVFQIISRREVKPLGGFFDWGANPPNDGMRNLAKALLLNVTGDITLTARFYMRFMYRVVTSLRAADDWMLEGAALKAEVERLKEDDRDVERIRSMVRPQPPPSGNVVGSQIPGKSAGYGGNDTAPDRRRG